MPDLGVVPPEAIIYNTQLLKNKLKCVLKIYLLSKAFYNINEFFNINECFNNPDKRAICFQIFSDFNLFYLTLYVCL